MNNIYLHCPYRIYEENPEVINIIRENTRKGDKIIMIEEQKPLGDIERFLTTMGYKVLIYKSVYSRLGVLYEAQVSSLMRNCDKFIGFLGRYDLPSLPFLTAAKYVESKDIIIKVL